MYKTNIVYKITNKKNNKFYIGSTENKYKRLQSHFNLHTYIYNQHNNLHLDIECMNKDDFIVDVLFETKDKIEASRLESITIRKEKDNPLMYNKTMGASGRRVFYESDIIFIRDLYASKTTHIDEAYDKYYKDIVTHRAFKKVWHGDTFKDFYYHVYTCENKEWHFSKGQSRPGEINYKSKLKESDVMEIRKRRDNGELRNDVYQDYKIISQNAFGEIWKNKSWKHLL